MKNLTAFAQIDEATQGGGQQLPAGGYVCKYTKIEDDSNKEYLKMEFDIAEGEFKDYYKGLEERAGFWGGRCVRSYKEAAVPFFKRMCSAVAKSNPGFSFNPFVNGGNADEQTLVGKLVGIVLQEEEYNKNNGEIGTRLVVAYECDVQKIREGNFKVPKKKEINKPSGNSSTDFMAVSGDSEEIPFN